jgi:putative two-component system response regulator
MPPEAGIGACIKLPLMLTDTSMRRSPLVSQLKAGPVPGSAHVLVVDDDEQIRHLLVSLLTREGHVVREAVDGESALAAVRQQAPDLVLLDVMMPGMTGIEVCRRLRQDRATRLTPVVLVTGTHESELKLEGLEAGADDFLTKPFDARELLARSRALLRLRRYTSDLESASAIISTLAVMIEVRDGYSEGHCHRMANYATALGRALGLPETDLQALHRGGFLHDIGMLAIPDAVLRKPGSLAPEEYELVKSHTIVGDELCANLWSLQSVRPIIRHHHEHLDGSGYPDGLAGDALPVIAQIMGVVDVYEAVTTERPYQRQQPIEEALDLLASQVDRGWRRKDIVDAFTNLVRSGALEHFAQP